MHSRKIGLRNWFRTCAL